MIDWAMPIFPLKHTPLNAGQVVSFDSDGVEEWVAPKRTQVKGSFEKTLSIKSVGGDGYGNATGLWLNGNPSKFLQGHNVFGSSDLQSLLFDVFTIVCKQFDLRPTSEEVDRVRRGDYEIKMLDYNCSYDLPTRSDVLSFIRALEFKAKTRSGRPATKGGTLYFNKTSTYWAIKFYCKAEEILTNRGKLPLELQNRGIEDWVDNKLRIELRLLSKELKRLGILKVCQLTKSRLQELFNTYTRSIEMTQQIQLTDEILMAMPNKLRSTYTLWTEGHDLRNMMSPATYKRHRKELKEYGINIDLMPESTQKTNVVPLVRVLEATPASIPAFAFEQGLVHHSAANF